MNIFDITIIEHPDFAADEAWIVVNTDAPQVPEGWRDTLPVPCILTGDLAQTRRMLALLHAIHSPRASATAAGRPRS